VVLMLPVLLVRVLYEILAFNLLLLRRRCHSLGSGRQLHNGNICMIFNVNECGAWSRSRFLTTSASHSPQYFSGAVCAIT